MGVAEDERADYHGALRGVADYSLHGLHGKLRLRMFLRWGVSLVVKKSRETRRYKVWGMAANSKGRINDQTYSAEPPSNIKWTLILNHVFQKCVYGLEFNERRNVKPAIVYLTRVDFTDAGGGSAFKGARKEVVLPMGW